jgi:hypothetical protein
MKTKSTGQLLLIASRILKSMYDSNVASLRDVIDAEENFLNAEYNHVGNIIHEYDIMVHRAYDYIENGVGRKTKITDQYLKLCYKALDANDEFEAALRNSKVSTKKANYLSKKSLELNAKLLKETNRLFPNYKVNDYISLLNMASAVTIGVPPGSY